MLVENQKVETRWSSNNKEWYIAKGYVFTKIRDKLIVNAEDLMESSGVKVKVECDYCKLVNTISYEKYIHSIKKYKNYACRSCVGKRCADVTKEKRQNNLYKKVIKLASDLNYKILTTKKEILNNRTYIEYICSNGHKNKMKIANFLSNKRCSDCKNNERRDLYKLSDSEVEKRIIENGGIWKNKGEYINRCYKNLKIECPSCKTDFLTSLFLFTQHGGQLCEECLSKITSVGEQKIKNYLDKHNIYYIREKWFDDCRDKYPLPFDFYIPSTNTIIEFDGRQHFSETNFFSYEYKKIHNHDEIKNEYCKNKNIHLIRIPYWNISKIDGILDKSIINFT